jgi:uncharacterized protein YbjT (DUF2867 family)
MRADVGGTILVTGATGRQGGSVARELLAAGHAIKIMTRKPASEAARHLAEQGAEVLQGDFDDAASLARCLKGVWGAFAVQNTWEAGVKREEEQGKRFAEVAREQGVQHFVYSSVGSAHRKTGIPHFDNKWRVEEKVRSLKFPSYTVIRAVFFMENFLSPWFKPPIDQGTLAVALKPGTALQMIAVADVGKYGRLTFEKHEELNGQAIDIAGDSPTMPEAAKIISQASGRTVEFAPPPIEAVRKSSEEFAVMLEWFDRVGYDADIAGNAARYRIPPTSFRDWARSVRWD